jgi:DNA polymerase IV
MPSTVAIRKCAELVFVPPRFDVYREVPNQIHAIFKDYTPLVEPLYLDEAYLDVTDNRKGMPTAWETAKEIRARIYDEIRLTASAGISCNKFLAKLASGYRKPNSQFAITPDDAEAFVAILPVAKFHGVGPKTAVKMRALGVETGADLRLQSFSFLQDRFGKAGSWYYDIARGRDDRWVQPDRERKSIFCAASSAFDRWRRFDFLVPFFHSARSDSSRGANAWSGLSRAWPTTHGAGRALSDRHRRYSIAC